MVIRRTTAPTLSYVEPLQRLGLTLTPEQHAAFLLLESRGYQFLVHYGLANAVEKADALVGSEWLQ